MKTPTPIAVRQDLRSRAWRRRSAMATAAVLAAFAAPITSAFDSTPYPGAMPPDGSASRPWKIDLPEDFDRIGSDGIHLANHHYQLTKDLDFADQDHRVRVVFSGHFEGNYNTVSHIRVNQPSEVGVSLFESLGTGGVVRCLAVTDSYFFGNRIVSPFTTMGPGTLMEQCYSRGNVVVSASGQPTGGIVSGGSQTTPHAILRDSFARENHVRSGFQTVGGISGYNDARVENCYSAGTTLLAPQFVGGVVGYGFGATVNSYSDVTNIPARQLGYSNGSWQNALVPDRYASQFDITAYSIEALGWDPAIWTKSVDGFPWIRGFNQAPIANAGPSQVVPLGGTVHLDGSATTDDHTPLPMLEFAWTIDSAPVGSSAALAGADTLNPMLQADLAGDYEIRVLVTDEKGLTHEDSTTVSAIAVVPNGGFENGFDGWLASGNVSIQSSPPYGSTEGGQLVSFNDHNSPPTGVISQVVQTVPGQIYQLEFDVGVLAYNKYEQRLGMSVTGQTELISDAIRIKGQGGGIVNWLAKSYQFTADSGTTTLTFRDLSVVTNSIDILLDHVRITSMVTSLLVSSTPDIGVGVAVLPPDTMGTADGNTVMRRYYNPGTVVNLAVPFEAGGKAFHSWLKNGDYYSTDTEIEVEADGNHQMTAVYWGGDPIITVQPVNAAALEGGNIVFRVQASGQVPLAYQWRFGGSDIPGANGAEWMIDPVKAIHAGTYDVIVSNAWGSVISSPVALSLQSGFVGLENGSFESDFQGWTVSGSLLVQSAGPYLATDGVQLTVFNSGNQTPSGVLSQTFDTTPGQPYFLSFDMGVLAYNTRVQSMQLVVTGSPSLLTRTFDMSGIGGGKCVWESHTLNFTADSPRTTLTFRDVSKETGAIDLLIDHVVVIPRIMRALSVGFGGVGLGTDPPVLVSPADANGESDGTPSFVRSYMDGTEVTLTAPEMLREFGPGVSLRYDFVKWMIDGSDHDNTAFTTVMMGDDHTMTAVYRRSPPFVIDQPQDVTVAAGDGATFHVVAELQYATEVLGYQWRFNGSDIPGAVTDTHVIDPVGLADGGVYDVVVTNAGGSTTSDPARLTVVENGLVNGSFESHLDGWTASGNVRSQPGAPNPVPDGVMVAGFNTGNSPANGVLSQSFVTVPGVTYRVEFAMGVLSFNPYLQYMQVRVEGSAPLASETYVMRGPGGGATLWSSKSLLFTADSSAATVTFADRSTNTVAIDLMLDKVVVQAGPVTVTTP